MSMSGYYKEKKLDEHPSHEWRQGSKDYEEQMKKLDGRALEDLVNDVVKPSE